MSSYEIAVKGYRCLRCRYTWVPRKTAKPRKCPHCNSMYWDIARRQQADNLDIVSASAPNELMINE
jgi:predicted Zn-ribbon and HTH transcriptional regulator